MRFPLIGAVAFSRDDTVDMILLASCRLPIRLIAEFPAENKLSFSGQIDDDVCELAAMAVVVERQAGIIRFDIC